MPSTRLTSVIDQLRALGLDGRDCSPMFEEFAVLDGDRFEPARTLEYLRKALATYERELGQMRGFAAKWGAPMEDVTDNYDTYSEKALRLRQAIELLEPLAR